MRLAAWDAAAVAASVAEGARDAVKIAKASAV
jgi:hypothetical protein